MRGIKSGTLLGLIVILVGATGTGSSVSARDESLSLQAATPAAIEGSWYLTGVGAPGTPNEDPMLATFSPDGIATISGRPVRPALPDMPHAYTFFSTGHGVWEPGEEGTVSFTVVHLRSDEMGIFRGSTTFSGTLVVGADSQSVTGEATYTVVDPTGTVRATIPTPLTGERIVIEPPALATPQS